MSSGRRTLFQSPATALAQVLRRDRIPRHRVRNHEERPSRRPLRQRGVRHQEVPNRHPPLSDTRNAGIPTGSSPLPVVSALRIGPRARLVGRHYDLHPGPQTHPPLPVEILAPFRVQRLGGFTNAVQPQLIEDRQHIPVVPVVRFSQPLQQLPTI